MVNSSSSARQVLWDPLLRLLCGLIPRDDDGSRGQAAGHRLISNAVITAGLQGMSLALGFALAVALAHLLGRDGYGRYVYAIAWAGLLTTPAILGLDRFLVRGVAVYEVRARWSLIKGMLERTAHAVLLSSTLIGASGCVVGLLWISPSTRGSFCLAMLLVPLTALTLLRQGAMQALGRVVAGQFPEFVIRPVLVLALVMALDLSGLLTPMAAVGANVAGVAIAALVGVLMLRRALPHPVRMADPAHDTRAWLRASLPMMLISGVWTANYYLATLMVGILAGTQSAAIYAVIERGASLIVVVLLAGNMALGPTAARLYAEGDRVGLERESTRIARVTFALSIPVALGLVLFPHLYLDLFGKGFSSGTTGLAILACGQVLNAAAGPAGNVLMMTRHETAAATGVGVGLLANIALGLLLIPSLSATGGAIAATASLVLWNAFLVLFARQRLRVNVTALRWLDLCGDRRVAQLLPDPIDHETSMSGDH